MFDDLLAANRLYQSEFHDPGVRGKAAKGLAVLTCIDSRIAPLAMLGLRPGDAKIVRNAGARVTDDALRSLVIAVNLLDVTRICIVHHTDCAMAGLTDDELREQIRAAGGVDPGDQELFTAPDQLATLRGDLARLRSSPVVPAEVAIAGFVFDVHSGELRPVAEHE